MLPTRPCRYCLGLQGDSVFADFDVDNEGRVFLVRISFDGFGCCRTPEARAMDTDTSRTWIDLVEADSVGSDELSVILSRYFEDNSDVIWKDALKEHDLLSDC